MQVSPISRARTVELALGAALVLVLVRATVSCILADPPAELPVPPGQPPFIQKTAVQPPQGLLIEWPATLVVPVLFSAPPTSTSSNAYNYLLQVDSMERGTGTSDGGAFGIVLLEVDTGMAPPHDQCHVVEFDVSNLSGTDSVVWTYAPNADFGSCGVFDAGPFGDAAFFDADAKVTIPVFDGGTD
jgi:hypothetical protein